jgi:hypothetical protein
LTPVVEVVATVVAVVAIAIASRGYVIFARFIRRRGHKIFVNLKKM